MEPFIVFIVIIYAAIYLTARKKARQKEAEQKQRQAAETDRRYASSNRPQPNPNYRSTNPNYRTTASSYSRPAQNTARVQSQSYSIDSTHYHREGYDFATCFSFKDVPKGADELTALIAANSRHERELQKLLHTKD